MPSTKKIDQVASLTEFLSGASIVIGTNYAGLSVGQLEGVRRAARDSGGGYRVVKNRLARRAAGDLGLEQMSVIIEGPLGLVVTEGEPVAVARALTTYVRTSRLPMRFTGAMLGSRVLTADELEGLANLPSREVLLAQALGTMNSVLSGLVWTLHAHLSSIVNVLEARRKQMDEGS